MNARTLVDILFLMLLRHRAKHLAVFALSVLVVGLAAAVLFLTEAVQRDLSSTLEEQADVVVQRLRGGRQVDLPVAWADEFSAIAAVDRAVPRVFGRYFHEANGTYFTVVGVDPFDAPASESLGRLIEDLDVREFLSGRRMVVGDRVRQFLLQNRYEDSYTFRTPEAEPIEVEVLDVLPGAADLVGGDLVLMEIGLARRVLGVAADRATDIVLHVPNEMEGDAVMGRLIGLHYDIRVIQKKEIAAGQGRLFQLRGGLFLVLYLVVIAAFLLILYQRWSLITGPERREIGLLRLTGWSIRQVIVLKILESLAVAVSAGCCGVILAYGYVFGLGAPLLVRLFLGFGNLDGALHLGRAADPAGVGLLLLFFTVPFLAAVLVPVWRLAIVDPVEALK